MKVSVYQFGYSAAGRALSARVTSLPVAAVKILEISKQKRQCTAPLILIKKHSVGYPSAVSHPDKGGLYVIISLYIRKSHYDNLLATKEANSER